MKQFTVMFCTAPQGETAKKIADHLVNNKFAACVNIIPGIQSIYTWKGSVCSENESLLFIKTKKVLIEKVKIEILSMHPYEVPEIIAVDIQDGLEEYLKWISNSTM